MDGKRFDKFSRAIAHRTSRREAIQRAGAGGFLAATAGAVGISRRAGLAQGDNTCTLQFYAESAVGPDKSDKYQGEIEFSIDDDGAIDDGTFRDQDGNEFDLVGQAVGRALNLRIALAEDKFLSLTGTGEVDLLLCRGEIEGTFGGPRMRDLGTWSASADGTPNGAPSPTPTAEIVSGNGGNNSGDSGDSGNNGDGGDNGEPTEEPSQCEPIDCGSGPFVQDPQSCECVCMSPYDQCGDVCCFGGATCFNDGSCACPDGTEACNEVCTPSCPPGQFFDNDCNCTADTNCPSGQTLCDSTGMCVSIKCEEGYVYDPSSCGCINRCDPGQRSCGGTCIDVVNDRNNCGLCDNVCITGVPCIAGTCECPATTHYDAGTQKCVAD